MRGAPVRYDRRTRLARNRQRHWRTRRDPFETTWSRVVEWLEAEPHRTAKELFERLQREHPGVFPTGQLRTLQRRVKDWRRLAARRLIFADPMGPPQAAPVSVITAAGTHEREPDAAPPELDQKGRRDPAIELHGSGAFE